MIERDIWISANLLLKQYGEDAEIVAAQRADAMLATGDLDGLTVWKQVITAIKALRSTEGVQH
ncbi:hypothetical protein [Ferrovibrio sp.]|uniref:hypothetical protein n=1 Tax=Ferrovibrio sp. TaxID=1917215 RepID=UPI0035B05ADA